MLAERYAEAIAAGRKSLELAPERAVTRGWLAVTMVQAGRAEDALQEALQEPEQWGRNFALALIHHAAGRNAESDEALRQLTAKNGSDAAYQVAEAHAMRGETDAAFEWLERAYKQRDAGCAWTMVDPLLRSLHEDPRWKPFLRKMRFVD